ncbi:MAG: GAF domain-containing protein [Chloroflexota bacterium]
MAGSLSEQPELRSILTSTISTPITPQASAALLPDELLARERVPARRVLDAITAINDLLLAPDGSHEIFADVAHISAGAFGYPFAAIILIDDEMRTLQVAGINNPDINRLTLNRGHNVLYKRHAHVQSVKNVGWVSALLEGTTYITEKPGEFLTTFAPVTKVRTLTRLFNLKLGMVVPLLVRAKIVGALMIGSSRESYDVDEQSDLLMLAHHTAVAIEMWRLYDRAEGRTAMLRELHTLSQTITGILDLDKLYAEVARAAGRLVNIDFCTVNTLAGDKKSYKNHAAWGRGARSEIAPGMRTLNIFPPGIVQKALRGEPILISDLEEFPRAKDCLNHRSARSVAVFPFKSDGNAKGFITVGRDEPGEWNKSDVEVLKQLSDYVTVAFTNAHLYAEAKRRAERMTTLHSTGEHLARIHEQGRLFTELRDAVQHTVDAPILRIALWNAEQEEMEITLEVVESETRPTRRVSGMENGPGAEAIESGKTHYVADILVQPSDRVAEEGRSENRQDPLQNRARSVLSVPLMSGNRPIGVLTVKSFDADAYSEDDIRTVQILAAQAAVTLDNIRLLQTEAQRAAEQTALAASAHAIARLDIDTVLQTIVDRASEIMKSSRCSLRLYDEQSQELYWAAGHQNGPELRALRIPVGSGVIGQVFVTGEPVLVNDLRHDPRAVYSEVNEAELARSAIAVPLKGQSGNVGVLATTHHEAGVFTVRDLEILLTFADYATIALSNAHLYSSLEQREEERTNLLHQLLRGQEAERRRVAVDIHDGPLQSIGVNILAIDRARKLIANGATDRGLTELVDLREGMSEVVQELRNVINDLRPVLLERQGLVVAAEAHLNGFTRQHGIESILEDHLNGERLPVPVELVFYRLMQEALTNVRKHAAASSVWVTFSSSDGMASISVTDNGCGFDPTAAVARSLASGHIGLHSMMERINVIGGGMEISSVIGQGARVTFRAPLL